MSALEPLVLPRDPVALHEVLRLHLLRDQIRSMRSGLVVAMATGGVVLWVLLALPIGSGETRRLALVTWALLAFAALVLRALEWWLAQRVRALADTGDSPPA